MILVQATRSLHIIEYSHYPTSIQSRATVGRQLRTIWMAFRRRSDSGPILRAYWVFCCYNNSRLHWFQITSYLQESPIRHILKDTEHKQVGLAFVDGKPGLATYEQQMHRPACASTQTYQQFCYSLVQRTITKHASWTFLVFQLVFVAGQ